MKMKYQVTGMTCAACSARVEKVTKGVPGVTDAQVNLLAGTMTVDAVGPEATSAIIRAISDAGYGASLAGDQTKKKELPKVAEDLRAMKVRIIGSAVFLGILMYFTMGHMVGIPLPQWYHGKENTLVAALLQFFLTLPAVYLNRVYYIKGFKTLWHI